MFPGVRPGLIVIIVAALVILVVGSASVGTVGAGERGVHLRFGAVTGTVLDEGLYFIAPFISRVAIMDVRIQKEEVRATASSSDLQTVASIVALNFHLEPDRAATVYQDVGTEYNSRLIAPALQESVKAGTAGYTAEELITKRPLVREEIKQLLADKLEPQGILVDDFNIVDFQFSSTFNAAIEAKVMAEQEALTAQNMLERIKFEAEQAVAEAKGKAQAITIEAAALKENPQVLQLRALETWDGVLPRVVTGDSIPFIQIQAMGP
jgi:regulator of protease activity HflC (stomatin/prohibitin superfamily)